MRRAQGLGRACSCLAADRPRPAKTLHNPLLASTLRTIAVEPDRGCPLGADRSRPGWSTKIVAAGGNMYEPRRGSLRARGDVTPVARIVDNML